MRVVIACVRPGLIRAGVRHPKQAEHLLKDFTPEQLRELLAEPELVVTLGRPLTHADIEALERGETPSPAQRTDAPSHATDGAEGAADTAPSDGAAATEEGTQNPARARAGKRAH